MAAQGDGGAVGPGAAHHVIDFLPSDEMRLPLGEVGVERGRTVEHGAEPPPSIANVPLGEVGVELAPTCRRSSRPAPSA